MTNVIKLRSYTCVGFEDRIIEIEVLRSRGLQQLILTGLPGAWLRDSRDKIRSLAARLGTWGALDRLLVHLLPCDESKVGAHLEVPIVLACRLCLEPELSPRVLERLKRLAFVGTVGLDGDLRSTEISELLEDLYPEEIWGPSRFDDIEALWTHLLDPDLELPPRKPRRDEVFAPTSDSPAVEGRRLERFLLASASLERLPTLLLGPPGVGKSHLAKWAHSLLSEGNASLRSAQRRIWSLSSSPPPLVPFLAPNSRVHLTELVGRNRGGHSAPGFFSLAHGGLLVLDEFSELSRDCREILRTILDSREIRRQGTRGSVAWPADFWLIATSNPCPCGFFGSETRTCQCPIPHRQAYSARLSGPLLDRFALRLFLTESSSRAAEKLLELPTLPEDPTELREHLQAARARKDDYVLARETRERLEREVPLRSRRESGNVQRLLSAFLRLGLGLDEALLLLRILQTQAHAHLGPEARHVPATRPSRALSAV